MFRTALHNVFAHKLRLFTTGLAVMLGVAFMAGTLVLTDTLHQTFDDLFSDVYRNTDAVVREKAAFENPQGFGSIRGRLDASMVASVARVPGVKVAQGDVGGYAQLADRHDDPVGSPNVPHFGTNWSRSPDLQLWTIVAGRPPQTDDEIVINKASADDAGYKVGDRAKVIVLGPPQTFRISGIVKFGTADSPGGASFVIFTTRAAQKYVGEAGKFDSVSVVADPGISQTEIARRIQSAVPRGTEVVTGEEITKETQSDFQKGMSFFNTFMFIFAVVALLVGAFMIFNTFFITVTQRARENALMRAIGASRRQVLVTVLAEALFVGVVASVIGLGLGVVVAMGLKALLVAFGVDLPTSGIVFSASTAVISLVAGVTITLVAAISPARKAGKIPPIAAMRDIDTTSTGYGSKERIAVGSSIVVLGVAAMLYGLFAKPDNATIVVGLAVILVFFGVSVLGRTVSLPLSRFIGSPLPRVRGIAGRLARENAMRNPKRTAATASALMIGVGLVGFITILASSTKASVASVVDKTFTGDLVVSPSGATGEGGLDTSLADQLNRLPEVGSATGLRLTLAKIDGDVKTLIGMDPQTSKGIIFVKPAAGSTDALGANSIGVFENVAEKKHLKLGDPVAIVFGDTGAKTFRVSLIFNERQGFGDWIIGRTAYEANVGPQYDASVFVKRAPGVSVASLKQAVERVADRYPGAKVFDQDQFAADTSKFVNQILGLVYALLALAILIALLGIGNTLALSILERTRELGVMRAVGMTRTQLRSSIRWESVIIALQGTLLGLVVGIFFGWALVRALTDQGLTVFSLPVAQLVVVVVIAGIAGVAAALLPARRAAKLNVLEAIVSE
jgi:putative ABC transport system permease protein